MEEDKLLKIMSDYNVITKREFAVNLLKEFNDYIAEMEYSGGRWIPNYVDEFMKDSEVWNGK